MNQTSSPISIFNKSCDDDEIKKILRSKNMRDIFNDNWRQILENLPSIVKWYLMLFKLY
jgi:hypothetical protein